MVSSFFTFPFEPMGGFLRNLSLSGFAGNMAAVFLYALISLIPAVAWIYLRKKGRTIKADSMLFLLSAVLFYVLYYSVNPGLLKTQIAGSGGIYLSGLFYSVLVTYGVIRISNMAMTGGRGEIQKLLRIFLYLLAVLFGGAVLMELFVALPEAIKSAGEVYTSATMVFDLTGSNYMVSATLLYAVAALDIFMNMMPYVFDIVIIIKALHLLKELEQDWYSKESVRAAGTLSEVTGRCLVIVTVLGLIYNLIQFIGRNSLLHSKMQISIPIVSIVFLLSVLLLARYIRSGQELKEENEMFI